MVRAGAELRRGGHEPVGVGGVREDQVEERVRLAPRGEAGLIVHLLNQGGEMADLLGRRPLGGEPGGPALDNGAVMDQVAQLVLGGQRHLPDDWRPRQCPG